MFDLNAFLTQTLPSGIPLHQRLCDLIARNRGMVVSAIPSPTLPADEALELLQYMSFINGLEAGGLPALAALGHYWGAYATEHHPELLLPSIQPVEQPPESPAG
jgi:hypothetical protein